MKPENVLQGEVARLFPVLSTTSKEGRSTAILLCCLARIEEFGSALLQSVGQKVGKRSRVDCFTEVTFRGQDKSITDRPDGLIVLRTGGREWKALVEAKVGNNQLNAEQVTRYRDLAKAQKIDCVITISNQFTSLPTNHPLKEVRKSRSKIPVFHWSWMSILTSMDLLLNNNDVKDDDQRFLLNELRRFLSHESAGVKGFDRMPPEWTKLNSSVSAGGPIPARSSEAQAVIEAWNQEARDLSLILSRQTETSVTEKLSRIHKADPTKRQQDEFNILREHGYLTCCLEIPNAAAPVDIKVDLVRRTVDVGMTIKAPTDRKSSKARVNWLLKQIKDDQSDDLQVRLNWPSRSLSSQYSYSDLLRDPGIVEEGNSGKQVHSFDVFLARRFGSRFPQQVNFITDLENLVPEFYHNVGQNLEVWRERAPKIKEDKEVAKEVSVEAISASSELPSKGT